MLENAYELESFACTKSVYIVSVSLNKSLAEKIFMKVSKLTMGGKLSDSLALPVKYGSTSYSLLKQYSLLLQIKIGGLLKETVSRLSGESILSEPGT